MSDIAHRKTEHLDLCRDGEVESGADSGLSRYRLVYRALPELDLADVDLRTRIAGKTLRAPLIIGAMTGGTDEARRVNRILAQGAQLRGIGLALGSARIVLERPESASSFEVRDVAPDVLLFANLGAVQLNRGITGDDAARLVELLGADALNLHLNPLQEAIQPEGDTCFRGLGERMAEAIPRIPVPVFVKEVGAGIGPETAALLACLPLAGVETAGVGGTSWARIEALRQRDPKAWAAGMALAGFGVPTAESVLACREAFPDRTVIASGGLRTPVEMATCLALGADAVAAALPFLKAASEGLDALLAAIDAMVHTLRILCFVTGARTPVELRGRVAAVDRSR
ncbi:MAG: type 2 isopentenyl-diphosphate Delta-isomerase [Deltaproteobacteria bacterium]|nr:type 2 isopentenyl-diphosphate Delta-isomerase [Deltaproteobacteria bacterium]MCB9788823.1 type 2 isopentenyl-diphosphate Delta-isomerase [Deltaproteobacteria bacterium]